MKDACSPYEDAISATLDGEEPGMPADVLEAHLSSCSRCREFQRAGTGLNRVVRLRESERVPDLTTRIVGAIGEMRPAAHTRAAFRLRLVLAVVAVIQLAVTAPFLFGLDPDVPAHAAHELGSFGVALGVGFLAVAWRPARAAGLMALAAVVAVGLSVTALADVASGVTSPLHEIGHVPELLGFALVWILAAPAPRHAEPGGEMAEAA